MSRKTSSKIGLLLATGLVAGLLVPLAASAADNIIVAPTLSIQEDCNAADEGTRLVFGGTVTPGSTVVEAHVRQHDAPPQPDADGYDPTNVREKPVTDEIQIAADGTISGSTLLSFVHASAKLASLYLIVSKDGTNARGHSNTVQIDNIEPVILRTETIDPKSISVVFSESVTNPDGDSVLDWTIDNKLPTGISGTGFRRTLTVQGKIGEDERPFVAYGPPVDRGEYQDCVGQGLGAAGRFETAQDKILPVVPNVLTIDGKDSTDGFVASKNRTAPVVVGNATNGHTITLWRETGETSGFDPSDAKLGEVAANNGATLSTGILADNTNHDLYATATDPSGNKSDGADRVVFHVDNIAPVVNYAQTTGERVTVAFSEALMIGRDDPADWRIDVAGIDRNITAVTGSGSIRNLNTSELVPNGSNVAYLGTAGYTDEAGNELASFDGILITGFEGTILDLDPETSSTRVKGGFTITATVFDDNLNPVTGDMVAVRAIAGPASKKGATSTKPAGFIGQCFSDDAGTCTITGYTSNEIGVDKLQGWIDGDQNPLTIEASSGEPADADWENSENAPSNVKNQDVIEATWIAEGVSLLVNAAETASSAAATQEMSVAASVTDVDGLGRSGTAIGGVPLAARVTSGPHSGSYLDSCKTNETGSCNLEYVGVAAGKDTIQIWVDRDENGVNNEAASAERSDADGMPVLDDPNQDIVSRSWVTAPVVPHLAILAEEFSTTVGSQQAVDVSVVDAAAKPLFGQNIDARVVSGPNSGKYIGECFTGNDGRCQLSYTSSLEGTDVIQAWIDSNRDNIANEATQAETPTGGSDEPDQDLSRVVWIAAGGASPSPSGSSSSTSSPSPSASPSENSASGPLTMTAVAESPSAKIGTCQNVLVSATRNNAPAANANIDYKLEGAGMAFCDAADAAGEGRTDSNGKMTLAVTSVNEGLSKVLVWADPNDNDQIDDGESAMRVSLQWIKDGSRSITFSSRKWVVDKGGFTVFGGTITAAVKHCSSKQPVKIMRKRPGRAATVVKRLISTKTGEYSGRVRIPRTARYFARVKSYGGCDAVRSTGLKIRVFH